MSAESLGDVIASLENVSKAYHSTSQPVLALSSISLTLRRGEYVSIVGPSGSGKSTLLSLLGCLDTPTSGDCVLFGHDIRTLSRTQLADLRGIHIGFIFQSFHLLPRLTAYQNIELPMLYRGIEPTERHDRIDAALTRMGISHRRDHLPVEMSGGEQQRVAIARAIAGDPELLIADEPTGNLDQKRGEEVLAVFDELHQSGQTLVVVTHDAKVAARTQRILEIRDGTLIGFNAKE